MTKEVQQHHATAKSRIPHVNHADGLDHHAALDAHEKAIGKVFEQARAGHIEVKLSQEEAPMLPDGRTGVRVIADRYETDPKKLHVEDKEYKDGVPV